MTPVIAVTEAPSAEARAIIENGLAGYNTEQAGYSDSRPLAVLVSDPDTRAVIRGRDVGRSMMRAAEDEARRRRCRAIVLYTISFQAPGFYERLGYRRFGSIDCDPPGTSRIFFVKELA
jgi:ribosomal protein S18 acetylase RimI-like enzyme